MPNVLFVCTANICRSPVAEAAFRLWLRRAGVGGSWQVGSAGTWAVNGAAVSPHSRLAARQRGLEVGEHKARRVDEALLAEADIVLCLAAGHHEALQADFPQHAGRALLWTTLAGKGYDIADPYGGPPPGYAVMVQELEDLVEKTGPRIVALARERAASNT